MRHAIQSGLSLLLVVTALVAGPAMARDHDRGRDRDYDRGHDRNSYQDRDYQGRNDRDYRYDRRRHDRDRDYGYYRDDRRGDRYYRPAPRVVYRPVYQPAYHRGYGPPPWARGGRYYDDGYGPTYVVRDYRGYGLRSPPRGYYWRRSDAGDFLLVAVATGIITDLILRH